MRACPWCEVLITSSPPRIPKRLWLPATWSDAARAAATRRRDDCPDRDIWRGDCSKPNPDRLSLRDIWAEPQPQCAGTDRVFSHDMLDHGERLTETFHPEIGLSTFLKGGDELTVEHAVSEAGVTVTVRHDREMDGETVRIHHFADESAADDFRANLEASLLKFGWVFIGYLPNRRRSTSHQENPEHADRRRWWTNGGTFLERRPEPRAQRPECAPRPAHGERHDPPTTGTANRVCPTLAVSPGCRYFVGTRRLNSSNQFRTIFRRVARVSEVFVVTIRKRRPSAETS